MSPSFYNYLPYFYRPLFLLTTIASVLIILSGVVHFIHMPAALFFLGSMVIFIPFLSPAWIILTLATTLLLVIAFGSFVHSKKIKLWIESVDQERLHVAKQLLESKIDKELLHIECIANQLSLLETVKRRGEEKQSDVNKRKKDLITDVERIKIEIYTISGKLNKLMNFSQEEVNIQSQQLLTLQQEIRQLEAEMFVKDTTVKQLQYKVKREKLDLSQQFESLSIDDDVYQTPLAHSLKSGSTEFMTPRSYSFEFKFNADHCPENTPLISGETLSDNKSRMSPRGLSSII